MPLRPTPVALSGVRVPNLFLPKKPNFAATKKLWDAESKSDDDLQASELKPFRVTSAWKEVQKKEKMGWKKTSVDLRDSYTKELCDRTSSHIGRTQDDLRRMTRPLRKWAERGWLPPGGYQGQAKSVARIVKFTRIVKFIRIWFLDFHIIQNLALIIKRLNSTMLDDVSQESLKAQLDRVEHQMKAITCARHVAQVAEERKNLFAIANTLRFLEVESARAQSEAEAGKWEHINPHRFPSETLRAVEMNLLKSEVLSMELLVRKRLLEAPKIQRLAFRTLREFGYTPNFPQPPSEEPDFDDEEE
ncbi:hypothetical protein FHL15_006950 [Xylaria flabelliformis]|uniref:Uncharacterized protein n=1 Tax=Xylaria flabelliformis TaxID=2512241 RepID=A0A553HVW4_9PEZI|nr:hypothetical protein FHL15_006950 [Xylaria flabelliformis]